MGLITKVFGTYSDKQIKGIMPLVNKIEDMADEYRAMSDDAMRAMTSTLKARLADGETMDDILPEAFALVREAADRVLGKRPFTVQLMGGIVLHQGRIAEMKTGEGKTLVATLPAYLNALTGNGVHVVTVNEYLARTNMEEMGRVHGFLGLTTGLILNAMSREEKIAAYKCDITYATNNELGFDYLRDNRVLYKDQITQREHVYAIIDEVDSILVDEARTPLIISGHGEKPNELYEKTDKLVRKFKQHRIKKLGTKEDSEGEEVDADFIVDEQAKSVLLTARGIKKAEEYFGIENLSDADNSEIAHHVNQAIRAYGIMRRDDEYVIKDGQVLIVDQYTGRIMPGRRFSSGLHQAIEAKENVKIDNENMTIATITFQNYFRMYKKLAGMTGTALTEKKEFEEIYALDVVEIPTNRPMIRKDHNDVVYKNYSGKQTAIVEQIKECNERGQPVLVGTVSVEKSEELSKRLKKEGIKHTVLNAKHHEKEAEVVALAGKLGRVTIATNMAGRGTDIMLGGNAEFMARTEMKRLEYDEDLIGQAMGSNVTDDPDVLAARDIFKQLNEKYKAEIRPEYEQVVAAGGLFILGTERHESRRIDNQLRGRAGRQGDPGESRFFISLQDDLMRLFGGERIHNMVGRLGFGDDQVIDAKLLSNSIETAQKRLEGENFQRRYNTLSYDDVMNQQRNIIYKQRREVLDGGDIHQTILKMLDSSIAETVATFLPGDDHKDWDLDGLRQHYMGTLFRTDDLKYGEHELERITSDEIAAMMQERAEKAIEQKLEIFTQEEFTEVERILLLRSVDSKWVDHLDAMDDLKGGVGLHAFAQRNPLNEYKIAGADMFDDMINAIREDTIRALLSVTKAQNMERTSNVRITGLGGGGMAMPPQIPGAMPGKMAGEVRQPIVKKKEEKVDANDTCPCGSGSKYKKCCGLK